MEQIKKVISSINLGKIKKLDKNTILLGVAILCVVVTGVLIFMNFGPSDKVIAEKSVEYINTNLLQGQGTATLESVSSDSGLIKFKIKIGEQTFDSYATKNGKLFFPQAFELNSNTNQEAAN